MLPKTDFYRKFSRCLSSIKGVLLLCGVLLSLSSCDRMTPMMAPEIVDTHADHGMGGRSDSLNLMTYNVYVGGSTEAILSVENLIQVPTEVASMYNAVITSDFPNRATSIAKLISKHEPHLIGLQEISLIRRQSPGDFITGGAVLAEEIVLDFLEILMAALHAEGLDYQVAAKVENIDVEMPMFTDTGVDDVRLTDYDVILARGDVMVSNPMGANFATALTIDSLGLEITRGYTAVDATVAGTTYRFVNTHLEAFGEEIRVAQAQELVDALSDETLPLILLGDFNTPAPDGTAYQLLLSAGYTDLWRLDPNYPHAMGPTCCQEADILNEANANTVRIDYIFTRGIPFSDATETHTIGDLPENRLPAGQWPSDHAGVAAHLPFPEHHDH